MHEKGVRFATPGGRCRYRNVHGDDDSLMAPPHAPRMAKWGRSRGVDRAQLHQPFELDFTGSASGQMRLQNSHHTNMLN